MKERKFTVLIPTRERYDTLEMSLKTVTNQDYENLEIIVSDNFSCDATEEVVRDANDKRVKYVNTGKRVSMSENWEFALSHVTGNWLTIIGDDDALLPNCFDKINKIADEAHVEAIRTSTCSYAWPALLGAKSGHLSVPMGSGWEIRDSKYWLDKVLNGEQHYTMLPMLYNGGFVSMNAIKSGIGKTGKFYQSCIPDVYSAVVLSQVIDKYVYSFEPVAINGASHHSTGTAQFNKNLSSSDEINPAQKYQNEGNISFHPIIPMCADGSYPKSIQALVYESYLQASEVFPDLKNLCLDQQLMVILATSGVHQESVYKWGRIFAKMHGLNFEKVELLAKNYSKKLEFRNLPSRVMSFANSYMLDSDELPIKDVYQASIMAGVIRVVRPPMTRKLVGKVYAKIQRMRG